MLNRVIQYSVNHKLIILLFTTLIIGFGAYSLSQIPIGSVPDITNNQVQIITTSRNLATEDVEKFLTYPVELEMANLPNVEEIRSVSKFGLSVVTVVFDDKIGTYVPRQLIAERIKTAEEKIPQGFGKPFMGPITTGLGEIYQYVIEVDSAYKSKYSLTDVRTMQDWVVKRQLSGIPGVVEVNTWGGFLKQYEVSINPMKLRSMNISLEEVFRAVEQNNDVSGGGYIEKNDQSFFIRGEGKVNNLEDIERTVVTARNGTPILVKDIAEVGFGNATRFGAITGNGEGEKVMGQVMMLKGENPKAVIEAVKNRVEVIQSTLPPGIRINGFLDRSELISKTTNTIVENLILGCLIVVFVVVLLLGNWRSGLVVASVIPLCLLFALSLMYLFKVDANLMSMGAIDFGIIIDGAVIIVEYIVYRINKGASEMVKLPSAEQRTAINRITIESAGKMMHSAIFGQLIIIIVFIPILSLVGVEGKMFRPMALVFVFALLGAMVLCFTYVPVIASMLIKPNKSNKNTISTRLITKLELWYTPVLNKALDHKKLVVSLAVVLLASAFLIFNKMGGEFVPTLDEGDFVIQPVLKTGTSLEKTVEFTTRMENILIGFPEVDQVVSRIGAAEVPTDPMSMEESDVIIKLKPKNEWSQGATKDDLADAFKEALSDIPGVDYEFTQPIEMRFNELITGVRADLAIKIFGEDLHVLYNKAMEVERAIQDIEGAADISVEKVVGLPQMTVSYDRKKMAKYGVTIKQLNDIISMGFAGKSTGTVFEGEKQFDLVTRFKKNDRDDIIDLRTASIQAENGRSIPLSEFAEITYTKGPAKISRDDTKRRIVIGVNVRNRDLASVVEDVQSAIASEVVLPTGYSVSYGGQFENLERAKKRLAIAVPIALILIFILLYFAFNSVKEALLIYSAIPLAAVGGVYLLFIRDITFSISAGVGFIALFGIAVLNGIVLIEEFKHLKEMGITNLRERVIIGTKNRMRPVLLTAGAAALGFLPMAVSASAGAEVQRPLATVVIGGLITATVLTLIVLPVLYCLFDEGSSKQKTDKLKLSLLLFPLLGLGLNTQAQTNVNSLDEAKYLLRKNNLSLKAAEAKWKASIAMEGSAWDLGKTELYYNYDQNNIAPNDLALKVYGVNQSLHFPTLYSAQHKTFKAASELRSKQFQLEEFDLERRLELAWEDLMYQRSIIKIYTKLDSMYTKVFKAAELKQRIGESDKLDVVLASGKSNEMRLALLQAQQESEIAMQELKSLIQLKDELIITQDSMLKREMQLPDTASHPVLELYRQAEELAIQELKLSKHHLMPDLNITLFQGVNQGADPNRYSGIQLGVAVPLFFNAEKSRIRAASNMMSAKAYESAYSAQRINNLYVKYSMRLSNFNNMLNFYDTEGVKLEAELIKKAEISYKEGNIGMLELIQLIERADAIALGRQKAMLGYNTATIEFQYLMLGNE